MNTLITPIFVDAIAEYLNLQSATPSIDFSDSPCSGTPTTGTCGSIVTSLGLLVTSPVAETAYYEIEFHLANNYWGCNFNFGDSLCGVEIRQAFAHMFDKASFCANSVIAGTCTAIDDPVPTSSSGGLTSPNPCAYDALFPQSGANCVVGASGGTAYHLKAATGANGSPWLYAPGSPDLNAAAQHLVDAGVATGFNNKTSVLTGVVTTNTPSFFIRSDDVPRKQLGESLASQICYIFTGSYTQPCLPYLQSGEAPLSAFQGFTTCLGCVNLNWWLYTAAFSNVPFFDSSLYFVYNSRFVSGFPNIQPPAGPCSPQSVPTSAAANYMYLCSPNYDNLSNQMENAPCLLDVYDPAPGSMSNIAGGSCPGTNQLSARSAGIQAEATFGAGAFTIPVFERSVQFGYLNNGWTRVINDAQVGLPNYFTWLNVHNPTPPVSGTIRQGFSETTHTVNPYLATISPASTPQDRYIVGSIYDSIFRPNPLDPTQQINWMTYRTVQYDNATIMSLNGYNPPPSTLTTYRFTLRNDLYFQDGRPVTAYDVAFSYLSSTASGANLERGASVAGITILGPRVLDIAVSSLGPFVLQNLASIYILPGRYWTNAGTSTWDAAVAACSASSTCAASQYAISGSTVTCPTGVHPGCASFPSTNMQVDPTKTSATYDPLMNGILIGSGPWECKSSTSVVGTGCSSSGAMNPPQPGGSYTLTRFGNGLPPGSSISGSYFRSSGSLAVHVWSEENDISPINPLAAVSLCFDQPVSFTGSCAHWQKGIGASSTGVVGINQVSIVTLRFNLNWINPFEWATSPPFGIAALPPVLYEGSVTLNPCSVDPVNGYDC